ncbi:MAG: DUF5343 domain-containing protein [Bryobacteraceae bacterium]|nr:DUF5343 domain-containing protein [Solibacteraceae bacterium]MCO5353691.1 DUF5343 domain-containing protein [Bryobacteraceae bacterium]
MMSQLYLQLTCGNDHATMQASMAIELPYLPTVKNVPVVIDKIAKAKVPDAFTTSYLSGTLGLKSTNDRALIPLLKKLGFLDSSGKPTAEYSLLKNKDKAKKALAAAIRRGYAALYAANESAHELPPDQLKGLVAQVSGTEEAMTKIIAMTFSSLVKLADFSEADEVAEPEITEQQNGTATVPPPASLPMTPPAPHAGYHPEFRFNIEVHLPSNGTEETYLNIFNALRKALA